MFRSPTIIASPRGIVAPLYAGFVFVCLLLATAAPVRAQSQALNAQIEGTITDATGATLPNVTVTLTNTETGTQRTVESDENGTYRAPLLPLGAYRVEASAANFKRLIREGITLTTGQTATIDLTLEAGGVDETVTISGDAPIADAARIDLGRVINEREVQNLPNVSRNPFNFGLLQANVTGRPTPEFGVPVINANGFARRANYQLDGNNNTQADRAGIRLMPISEIFVSEVQLVTNGFAPEFGNTPGIIFNSVTPAGTNEFHGSVSYRFRRTAFSSRAFYLSPTAVKPETKFDDFAGAVGGPIIRDRWQFYTGYERATRDLASQRLLTISAQNQQALIAAGVSPDAFPAAIPASQKVDFFIVRTDAQLTDEHRLVGRYNLFRNASPNNIGGGANTLQRSVDFIDAADSVGIQLISTLSSTLLNEFRYQYAERNSRFLANANSGTGVSIVIPGVALFGAPEDRDTIAPLETSNQVLNNVTLTRNTHTMKFGGGFNKIDNVRRSNVFARYQFANIETYRNAVNGTAPRGYTQYVESIGDPDLEYGSVFYQFFAQDDWKVTPRLKFNYGLRYDLYDVPQANGDSPLEFSRNFRIDKNNFAPRFGAVYALREGDLPTVIRGSAGLYYEPPYTDIYRRAIQSNGDPRYFTLTLTPASPAAPNFPNTLGSLPAGTPLPPRDVDAVSPDYENLVAFHINAQIEQALSRDFSLTAGFVRSRGTHLPVYRNLNVINPTGFLEDGRPVFNRTLVNANTRLFPQFNNIFIVESVGTSNYVAGTLSLNKRFSSGYQFSANYTLSRATDDAPEQNLVNATVVSLSDPTNRERDRGFSLADQRHTFALSFVGRPTFDVENRFLRRLLNDNQFGFITVANSGERFNILSNLDLNGDNLPVDRPLFIERNSGRTPNRLNIDMRYSRIFTFTERFNFEVIGEFTNLFNRKGIIAPNSATVTTSATGAIAGGTLPEFFISNARGNPTALESRQFSLGFKFNF